MKVSRTPCNPDSPSVETKLVLERFTGVARPLTPRRTAPRCRLLAVSAAASMLNIRAQRSVIHQCQDVSTLLIGICQSLQNTPRVFNPFTLRVTIDSLYKYDDCRATPVCSLMLSDSCGSGFILYRFGLTIHVVLDNAVCTRDTVVAAPPLVDIGGHSPHSRQRTTPRLPCRCARTTTGSSAEFET